MDIYARRGSEWLFGQHLGCFDDQLVLVFQLGCKIRLCSTDSPGPHDLHDGVIRIGVGRPCDSANKVPPLVIDVQRSEGRVDGAVGEEVDRYLHFDHHVLVLSLVPGETRSERTGGGSRKTERLAREVRSGDRLGCQCATIGRFESDGRRRAKRVTRWLVRLPVCACHPQT